MSRLVPDGVIRVHVVDTISDGDLNPTLAEITGGTEITDHITRTGINLPEEATDADSSDLGSDRDKSVPATIGGELEAELFRDDGTGTTTDAAWEALPRLLITNLVVARFGGSGTDGAIASGDVVEVYPVRVSQRSNNRLVSGETMRFVSIFALRDDPNLEAVVDGS